MLWLKIILFIIFFIINTLTYYFSIKVSSYITRVRNLKLRIILNLSLPTLVHDAIFIFFSIWLLTFYLAWTIFLFFVFIIIIPLFALIKFLYNIDNEVLIEMVIQENIHLIERPIIPVRVLFFFQLILGILIYVVIGIVYFGLDLPSYKQVEYIIAFLFIFGSIYLLMNLFVASIRSISPNINTLVRKDYILTSVISIFRLSFISYFILWILDINLFDTIFILNGINFYWLYVVLFISILLFIYIALLFSIGERRRKREELFYLKERKGYFKEIFEKIDPQDINQTKEDLKSIVMNLRKRKENLENFLNSRINRINTLEMQSLASFLIVSSRSDLQNIDPQSIDSESLDPQKTIVNSIIDMEKPCHSQITFLDLFIDDIDVNIESSNSAKEMIEFRKGIHKRQKENIEEKKKVKTQKVFFWKANVIWGFIWFLITGLLNISLSQILEIVAQTLI